MWSNDVENAPSGVPRFADTPTRRWMRYQCSLVAPFLDPATYRQATDDGWRLVESDDAARAALTRTLASTFGKLMAFDDAWIGLRPCELGAVLDTRLLPLDQGIFHDVLGDPDDQFDPALETCPTPTIGALRVVGAVAASLAATTSHLTVDLPTPSGTPRRLFGLRRMIDRWLALSGMPHRSGGRVSAFIRPRSTDPFDVYLNALWSPGWEFAPADLHLAVKLIWMRVSAYDPYADWIGEAADAAWMAWRLSELPGD